MSYRLLIIDDDPRSVEALKLEVKPLHHEVTVVNDQESAFKLLERNSFDYALVDIRLKAHPRDMAPDIEVGYATIHFLRERFPSIVIIAVTAFDETSEINTQAIKSGADDFWSKNPGGSGEKLLAKIRKLMPKSNSQLSNEHSDENRTSTNSNEVGSQSSQSMAAVNAQVKKFAPTDTTILLLGQPGTGKGFLAEEIHRKSKRKDRLFKVVNCPQLSKSNIESELFGHKKGSFTGAVGDRKGLAISADGGTLFFDEIGDMDLESQAVILRFIEQKEVKPFGSDEVKIVDVRIIAATNQPLESLMSEGKFRKDLYSRLSGVVVHVPLLKDRNPKEIEKLAKHFYQKFREDHKDKKGFKDVRVKSTVWRELAEYEYDWPGNVRELMQVIHATLIEVGGKNIQLDDFTGRIHLNRERESARPHELLVNLTDREKKVIDLIQAQGHVTRKDVEGLLSCGTTAAWKYLQSLVKKGFINCVKSGRKAVYRLRDFKKEAI